MANNLAIIREVFTSRDHILYNLRGLDGDYNSFVSSMYLLMRYEEVSFKDF